MSILIFIAVLGILILSHEFGHFILAKIHKIKVEEFAFGFPPRLFGFQKGETLYSVNLIPFGGFVKIFGEESREGKEEPIYSFSGRPVYSRALIIAAGIFFNLLLAWIFLSAAFLTGTPVSLEESHFAEKNLINKGVMVIHVEKNTPAEIAGLKPGDFLLRLLSGDDALDVSSPEDVKDFVARRKGGAMEIEYMRNQKKLTASADKTPLGIAMDYVGVVKLPFFSAFWEGLKRTIEMTKIIALAIGNFLADLFTKREMLAQVAGPVGIASLVGSAAQSGFVYILQLVAILSINLALINLVPFPALDGGRLLFLAVEFIKGKPVSRKFMNIANNAGFAILILLMLAVTYSDISRLIE
jgi:regulator of sigma E protease